MPLTLTSLLDSLSSLVPADEDPVEASSWAIPLALQAQMKKRGSLHRLSKSDQAKAQSIFVTMHILFPHELLPALDILDRGFVTKFAVDDSTTQTAANEVYYVQSASAADQGKSKGRYRAWHPTTNSALHYEVHLDSWNCTCPAFSVSAFHALGLSSSPENDAVEAETDAQSSKDGWAFGGLATRNIGRAPSCKHILAAVLAQAAPRLFEDGFQRKEVSRNEMAAWGAGWADLG